MTPLGTPVMPLEKMTAASESGVRRPRREQRRGAKRAASQRAQLGERRGGLEQDLRCRPCRAAASIFALARKAREVMTVRMPHCSMARLHGFGAGGEVEVDGDRARAA